MITAETLEKWQSEGGYPDLGRGAEDCDLHEELGKRIDALIAEVRDLRQLRDAAGRMAKRIALLVAVAQAVADGEPYYRLCTVKVIPASGPTQYLQDAARAALDAEKP